MQSSALFVQRQYGDDPITESDRKFFRGMYRAQYRKASTDGLWGRAGCSCGSVTLVRYRLGQLVLMPALCGCFSCPLCGVKRAAWLAGQTRAALSREGLEYFWTITIRRREECPSVAEQVESHQRVKRAWNYIRTVVAQRNGGPFRYVWVSESTKAGIGHLHILTEYDIAGSELARLLLQATGDSFICDVEPVSSDRAATYVAKYVMQQVAQRPVELKGSRVYSKSRSVQFEPFRPPSEHPEEWSRWQKPYWEAVALVAARGDECGRAWVEGSPFAVYKDTAGTVAGIPAVVVSIAEYASLLAGPPG